MFQRNIGSLVKGLFYGAVGASVVCAALALGYRNLSADRVMDVVDSYGQMSDGSEVRLVEARVDFDISNYVMVGDGLYKVVMMSGSEESGRMMYELREMTGDVEIQAYSVVDCGNLDSYDLDEGDRCVVSIGRDDGRIKESCFIGYDDSGIKTDHSLYDRDDGSYEILKSDFSPYPDEVVRKSIENEGSFLLDAINAYFSAYGMDPKDIL